MADFKRDSRDNSFSVLESRGATEDEIKSMIETPQDQSMRLRISCFRLPLRRWQALLT